MRELANTVPDVNKDADDEEQEQQMAGPSVPSTSKNGFVASLAPPSSGQQPNVPKRGRPRKRPLEDDVSVQPLDYATRKVPMAPHYPQSSPSGSSAAALAAVVGSGSFHATRDRKTFSITQQQSIINRPGTSRSQVVSQEDEDDDETDDEEDEDDEDEENSEEEEEMSKPINDRKGAQTIASTRGTNRVTPAFATSTSSANMVSVVNSAAVAEIDDDYDN